MKKNKAMRAAGVFFIATMLTTCMTAGTLAKYVTGDQASDSARVAKFGVVVTANGSLFGQEYAATTADTAINYSATANTGTVQVNATDQASGVKLVAPGTKSAQGLAFAVTGTPEVDVNATLKVDSAKNIRLNSGAWGTMVDVDDFVTAENFASYVADTVNPLYVKATANNATTYTKVAADATFADANEYCQLHDNTYLANAYYPVQYSLVNTGSNNSYDGDVDGNVNTDTLAAVVNLYAQKFGTTFSNAAVDATKAYGANVKLDSANGTDLGAAVITWQWKFEQTNKAVYDPADTVLGDLIAGDGFDGVVVYNGEADSSTPNTFSVPTGTAADAAFDTPADTDFNLYTALDMSISVTQID